ncbi:outer membrane transport energization protein ExbD [Prosthecobacter debontii]|uniref:Outer membrane transport energization protein ExbD n=1 Tax=Prosthecobacter debontii TaxID=48467 RepID=A0A1T4XQU9_9BACT|nr:biopolymer transporter ExbD [Prosthecobacter debontii]SKA91917.1 outer membrane transport energization protein ExbD [Prosthecobacter debontii]
MKIHSPIAHKKTRLEIIPLIDVMFFLLASFMMVSLTMTKQQTIKVNLPVAAATQADFKPDMINLGVNQAGDIYLDTVQISLPDLDVRLKERFKQDPNTPVYISGDGEARHADMVRALDAVRRAGFSKVAFNVKPTGTGPAAPSANPTAAPSPAPSPAK